VSDVHLRASFTREGRGKNLSFSVQPKSYDRIAFYAYLPLLEIKLSLQDLEFRTIVISKIEMLLKRNLGRLIYTHRNCDSNRAWRLKTFSLLLLTTQGW